MKNFWMYSTNATSVPNAITPATMRPLAYHTVSAIEMELTASTSEKSDAS